ncbi:MAG: hypothetical protein JRF71_13815 [Deltaproteobacteria bacterium]|nr:hypothetical protein [Deltaproteobacteria bacterium]
MKKTGIMVMAVLICLAFSVTGYAKAKSDKEVMEEMKQPINCSTAEGDLRMLEHEKAHVAKQIANGVMAIVPISAVIGIITGHEKIKIKVATGEYNKLIDKRIAEIKAHCGID